MNTTAKLFIWKGAALYVGPLKDVTEHRHHAAQVCFGLEGDFNLYENSKWQKTCFAALPSNSAHIVDSGDSRLVTALIDGDAERSFNTSIATIPIIETMPRLPQTIEGARQFLEWLIMPSSTNFRENDPRIEKILTYIASLETKRIDAARLADYVSLSESRFLHLFKEQVGLPLRRFLLWGRIIDTIDAILAGESLTMAAHIGGFSDSAHFSRTFRETFGLAPSELFKNSRNVQVIT